MRLPKPRQFASIYYLRCCGRAQTRRPIYIDMKDPIELYRSLHRSRSPLPPVAHTCGRIIYERCAAIAKTMRQHIARAVILHRVITFAHTAMMLCIKVYRVSRTYNLWSKCVRTTIMLSVWAAATYMRITRAAHASRSNVRRDRDHARTRREQWTINLLLIERIENANIARSMMTVRRGRALSARSKQKHAEYILNNCPYRTFSNIHIYNI